MWKHIRSQWGEIHAGHLYYYGLHNMLGTKGCHIVDGNENSATHNVVWVVVI